jgi:hypothetical protein
MVFRHFETLLHRLHQSCFSWYPEGRFSGPFAYLKHHYRDYVQIAFLNACYVENVFEWPFDIMKHPFNDITKVAF